MVQRRAIDDCMTNDGFAAPTLPTGGPPNDLGNPQFPNLPAIEASHDLGLFTGGGFAGTFVDQQSGMDAPERAAWQARISHCFMATQTRAALFGSAHLAQLNSGWFNIVNRVAGSKTVRDLSKAAARCSAAHGVPASSVQSLYGRMQGELGPLFSAAPNNPKVLAIQAKGATVLGACWSKVIDETTAQLSARRPAFLAQNASAITALQSAVDAQVRALQRQYGLKLTLVGS